MADSILKVRAPLANLPIAPSTGRGVVVSDRARLGLATVVARRTLAAALAQRVHERFGVDLPRGPYRTCAGDVCFLATGPETWLATHEHAGHAFAAELEKSIGDLAAVSDQSSGYAVFRLAGPKLYETLAKLLPIDLHPRRFTPGSVASTVAAHMAVTAWRLDDSADGSSVFEIAVFRSFAASFRHALSESAAEFGLVVS